MEITDKLKYMSTERMYEGVLVEITDASVTIDIKGRLGQLKIPLRMLISEYEIKIGQEVGFMMSFPEVLEEEANEHYLRAIEQTTIRRAEIAKKNASKLTKGENNNEF